MEIMNFMSQPQVIISLAVLIILLWRISYGYKYGVIFALIEIAALATGVAILSVITGSLSGFLNGRFANPIKTGIQIAVIVFVYKAIKGIANGVKDIKDVPVLGKANRFLGAIFGAVETYIWVAVLQHIIGYNIEDAIFFTFKQISCCIHI